MAESHTTAKWAGDGYFEAKDAHFVRRPMEGLEMRKQAAKTAKRRVRAETVYASLAGLSFRPLGHLLGRGGNRKQRHSRARGRGAVETPDLLF